MSPRQRLGPRIARVLTMLPYINEHQGVTVDELARRFAVDEEELRTDLELLPLCGLPPYTPDRLIDLWIADDGEVSLKVAEYFERPPRIPANEGLAVLAAGRALLKVPGADPDGALASALEKLAGLLPHEAVEIEIDTPDALGELRRAAQDRESVEMDYYSLGRDELTTRTVDPHRISLRNGRWYVEAFCHTVDDVRTFRVDRIRELRPTGTHFSLDDDRDPDAVERDVYVPGPDAVVVELRLGPRAAWLTDSAAVDAVEIVRTNTDGSQVVRFPVSNEVWLERLLVRLGSDARVLAPPQWTTLAAGAARRVLTRYTP